MSADFISDLDIVDQATVETTAPAYPVAQWLHGDPKMAASGGVAHTGGILGQASHGPEAGDPLCEILAADRSGCSDQGLLGLRPRKTVA